MYAGRDFSEASPRDVKNYSFDFRPIIPEGVTVVSTEWTIAVVLGSDVEAATAFASEPSLSGLIATRRIGPLKDGAKYRVEAIATCNDGSKIALHSHIRCGWARA